MNDIIGQHATGDDWEPLSEATINDWEVHTERGPRGWTFTLHHATLPAQFGPTVHQAEAGALEAAAWALKHWRFPPCPRST